MSRRRESRRQRDMGLLLEYGNVYIIEHGRVLNCGNIIVFSYFDGHLILEVIVQVRGISHNHYTNNKRQNRQPNCPKGISIAW